MSSTSENIADISQGTSKPNLSLEEELEVLLPIYVFGQSKGWDFLQPDQVQKLIDNGRIIFPGTEKEEVIFSEKKKWENAKLMVDVFMSTLIKAFEKALVEKSHYCPQEEWDSKDEYLKWLVVQLTFGLYFDMRLDKMPEQLYATWSTGL